jgi:hypothetical protein
MLMANTETHIRTTQISPSDSAIHPPHNLIEERRILACADSLNGGFPVLDYTGILETIDKSIRIAIELSGDVLDHINSACSDSEYDTIIIRTSEFMNNNSLDGDSIFVDGHGKMYIGTSNNSTPPIIDVSYLIDITKNGNADVDISFIPQSDFTEQQKPSSGRSSSGCEPVGVS